MPLHELELRCKAISITIHFELTGNLKPLLPFIPQMKFENDPSSTPPCSQLGVHSNG